MSSHHKHQHPRDSHRERDRLLPPTSFYSSGSSKDYHVVDPHYSKRRLEDSRGGNSKLYPNPTSSRSYSSDRHYEDKKHHHGQHTTHSSGSGSYHQPYSGSSSHHHHRPSYDKHSSGAVEGSHHSDHHGHSHGSSSHSSRYKAYEGTTSGSHSSPAYHSLVTRAPRNNTRLERAHYRKPYEKVSSSSSGIRRIPPPLSPPPLMKIATSAASSRYRQAPPEDPHHQRQRVAVRSPRAKQISKPSILLDKKPSRKPIDDVPRAIKRSAEMNETDRKPVIKRIRNETRNGDTGGKRPSDESSNNIKIERPESKSKYEIEKVNVVEDVVKGDENSKDRRKGKQEGDGLEPSAKRPLLKLHCTYCNFRCVSFKDFSIHTRSFPHSKVMNSVIDKNRTKLISLKHEIRDQLKEIEKSLDEQKTLADTTSYCRVCEINLRTDPKEHEANEIHNEIKGIVDRRCELCNVDFRLWKVYLFHTVSLEHVKRVALKEMKDREGQKDAVAGSNMTIEDLGLDLLEQKHVIFCKACIRYFPIREENYDESSMKHCMSLNHVKFVEEYTNRMKYIAKRDAEEEARIEAKRLAKKAKENEAEKSAAGHSETIKTEETNTDAEKTLGDDEADGIELKIEHTEDELDDELDTSKEYGKHTDGDRDRSSSRDNQLEDSQEEEEPIEEPEPEDEEPDEDEIQLHADEDDEVDPLSREDE